MKAFFILFLFIPNLLLADSSIIFCYSYDDSRIKDYTIFYEINKNKKVIKNLKEFHNPSWGYAEFVFPGTDGWDAIYPNYEILNIRFEKNHISFQNKFNVENNETAIDFIEIDEISGTMVYYSYIFYDVERERFYWKDNDKIIFFENNDDYDAIKAKASVIIYQCEKDKEVL